MTVSKSPDRFRFQKDVYIKRYQKSDADPNIDYLAYLESLIDQHNRKFDDPESRINNLEYDLLTTGWILDKVRVSDSYAQNLYACLCNRGFVKKETIPLLRQHPDKDVWSCSWRYAGGIIADMRQKGDYIDWYCSGICMVSNGEISNDPGYVSEGCVTDEIREDLLRLGWVVLDDNDDF